MELLEQTTRVRNIFGKKKQNSLVVMETAEVCDRCRAGRRPHSTHEHTNTFLNYIWLKPSL